MKKSSLAAIIGGIVLALGIAGAGAYLIFNHDAMQNLSANTNNDINNTTSDSTNTNSAISSTTSSKSKITSGGIYTFSGTLKDKISVDTTEAVTLILDNVSITSSDGAAIKCQENSNVTIQIVGSNTIISNSENDGINSEGDLTITGDGSLNIDAEDDAIHADGKLIIENGTITVNAHEGLEATYIIINSGTIKIIATDDGINAGNKSDKYSVRIEINGGDITVDMGQGDTDAIDSNGDLIINGGKISITAQSPFDWDGTGQLNGGTVIVNGEKVTELTNQFGGDMMGGSMMSPRR